MVHDFDPVLAGSIKKMAALGSPKGFRGLGLGSGNIRVRTEKLGLGSAKLRVKMAGNIKVKWREI